MPNSPIPFSNLPAATMLDGTEIVPIVQGGTSKRTTISQITTEIGDGFVTPEQFGWSPGDDLGVSLRAAFAYCATSAIKEIRLFTDSSDANGYYKINSRDPATNNRCVFLSGSSYNGIVLRGLGRNTTRIRYDYSVGLVSRSILSTTGCDLTIIGITFDGAEQDRIPVGGGTLTLNGAVLAGDGSIAINNGATYLPSSGVVLVDSEWIGYTGLAGSTITGCIRGIRGTTAAAHSSGAAVTYLTSSGHHPVGIGNFRRLLLVDVGILNSVSYGLGIENTGTDYVENLEINGLYIENTSSDGVDIKCPVANGNKYARISNVCIKGWSRENGWFTNADNGLDLRIPGAMVTNADFIFTDYMGDANAINVRANQTSNYSGGQFATWANVQCHGQTTFGTEVPSHAGISDSGGALFTNFVARNLTGAAMSLRGSRVTNFEIDSCLSGAVFNGTDSTVAFGRISNCSSAAVLANTGALANVADTVETYTNAYGFLASGTGVMTVRNPTVSGNTTADYSLTAECQLQFSEGGPLAKTSAFPILIGQAGTIFSNLGTVARVDFTLPAAAAGLIYSFYVADTDGIRVIAAAGDTITSSAGTSIAGGRIDETTIGSFITLRAMDGTIWLATVQRGTWTAT